MEPKDLSLEGQVAIVTGGGSGIGRSIALEFARSGADVVVASRRLAVLEEVAEEIRALGRRSLCVPTDTSQKTSVDSLVQRVIVEFGTIDILVNNAAAFDVGGPLLELSEADWDRVIGIDLKGYLLCSQAAGKKMVEHKKGNIINIASVAGFRPFDQGGVYNIAKGGAIMLTQILARQLASSSIRVNAIAPGYTKTEMTENVWGDPERLRKLEAFIPLGHMADPSDIAHAALFLASEASKHITGHTMLIDGGQLLQYRYGV